MRGEKKCGERVRQKMTSKKGWLACGGRIRSTAKPACRQGVSNRQGPEFEGRVGVSFPCRSKGARGDVECRVRDSRSGSRCGSGLVCDSSGAAWYVRQAAGCDSSQTIRALTWGSGCVALR